FVNAVLRRVGQQDENAWVQAVAPPAAEDPVGHLAMVHSHPRWVAQAFAEALAIPELPDDGAVDAGGAELATPLAAARARPLVHLAARPGQLSAAELAALTGGDIAPYSPYAVHLADGGDPGELAPVREHLAQVQDEGSQLVALALAGAPLDGPDARWLDL